MAIASTLIMVTACGSDSAPAAKVEGCESTLSATVPEAAPLPITAPEKMVVDLKLGDKECIGFNVLERSRMDPATFVADLASGRIDFATLNVGQLVQAVTQGMDLKIIAPGAYPTKDLGLWVPANSNIKSIQDLRGKKLGLGALNTNSHAAVVELLEAAGVRANEVDFQMVQITELAKAVTGGTVDAAVMTEPQPTLAGGAVRNLVSNVLAPFGNEPIFFYAVTSGRLVREETKLVDGFQRAYCRATLLAAEDEQIVRQTVASHNLYPQDAVARMPLPAFGLDFKRESYDATIASMARLGFFKVPADKLPSFDDLVYNQSNCESVGKGA